MKLSDVQKRSIFKALANKSQFHVGLEFGLDKHYATNIQVTNAVNKVYRQVKEAPEKYALDAEILEIVEKGMKDRQKMGTLQVSPQEASLAAQAPDKLSEKDLVLGARRKGWVLLHRKLDQLGRNKKALAAESIMNIAKVAGITFDKGQIVTGEATEHVLMKAKIDGNISSEEALAQLARLRERTAADED